MTRSPPPPPPPTIRPRPCPVCGIAMQASKSRADLDAFDIYQCQSCQTTIEATPRRRTR